MKFKAFPEIHFPKWLTIFGFKDYSYANDEIPFAGLAFGDRTLKVGVTDEGFSVMLETPQASGELFYSEFQEHVADFVAEAIKKLKRGAASYTIYGLRDAGGRKYVKGSEIGMFIDDRLMLTFSSGDRLGDKFVSGYSVRGLDGDENEIAFFYAPSKYDQKPFSEVPDSEIKALAAVITDPKLIREKVKNFKKEMSKFRKRR